MPYHRWKLEKALGKFLNKDEIVWHKNGNILDNRLSNLFIGGYSKNQAHDPTYEDILKFKEKFPVKSKERYGYGKKDIKVVLG